jgi:hypothetical protein
VIEIVRTIALTLLLTPAFACLGQVSVYPSSPKELETVRVRLPLGALGLDANGRPDSYEENGTTLTMVNNKITVSLLMKGATGFPVGVELDWPLGQLPPGNYEVEVTKRSAIGVNEGLVGRTSFTVSPRPATGAIFNFTDLYWDVSEPGWGISVTQLTSGQLFLIWFVYDTDGKPVWYYVSDGEWFSKNFAFRGTVYRAVGSDFSGKYDPSRFQPAAVGTAEIAFSPQNFDHAAFIFTMNGKSFAKIVRRQKL